MNIQHLNLIEHPEGGRFREVHRSPDTLDLPDGRRRNLLTHIYFHLRPGERSVFHRVGQEEVWNLYQGAGVRLWLFDEQADTLTERVLSPESMAFCQVVPAGVWQAAEPLDGDALVGCTVAPGFDFEDFDLMPPDHPAVPLLREEKLGRLIGGA